MWAIENNTDFAAERGWARDQHGAEVWLVCVKATFTFDRYGGVTLAEKQEPIKMVPEYWGEPATSSLRYEADLVLGKPATDVIVHGSAHAPAARATVSVEVNVRVGPLAKSLRVFGDRVWTSTLTGLGVGEPAPFVSMPIRYERAFGGVDLGNGSRTTDWERRNPVGSGLAARAGEKLPNIENPGDLIGPGNRRPGPAGFGPIARDWSPRIELAGTYDEAWQRSRFPLPPADFDERFFQCTPGDQQVPGYLRGGEQVELRNLTPEGYVSFTLPKIWLTFSTDVGDRLVEHRARLHTLILEPDERRLMLVWHTALPCHGADHKLQGTVIDEKEYIG